MSVTDVFAEIRASAGLGYGVGPVAIKDVLFNGELFPLEDDPKVKATLKGKLAVPAYGEIYGTFGARLGSERLGRVATLRPGVASEGAVDEDVESGTRRQRPTPSAGARE